MEALKPVKEGKVREIYDNGDTLIMVATDRISCFDVILHNISSDNSRNREIYQQNNTLEKSISRSYQCI